MSVTSIEEEVLFFAFASECVAALRCRTMSCSLR